MKRSRAPSSRSHSMGATTRGSSSSSSAQSHAAACRASGGGYGGVDSREESQQSLEVDVGCEDLANQILAADHAANCDNSRQHNSGSGGKAQTASSGGAGGRRRSSRGGSRKSRGAASAGSSANRTSTSPSATSSNGDVKPPVSNSTAGGASSKQRASTRGTPGGDNGSSGGAAAAAANGQAGHGNGMDRSGGVAAESSGSAEGQGDGKKGPDAGGGGSSEGPPPAKKPKKKYIRNPETHKVYRERMERELAQARTMLADANTAMVQLARDYKRQQAIIEKYQNNDNSLFSTSQLTQSQPTNQQQQQQQQQQLMQAHAQAQGLQLHHHQQQQVLPLLQQPPASPQHQQMQQPQPTQQVCGRPRAGSLGDCAGGDAAGQGVAASLEAALLEPCSQESIYKEPEMSQDMGMAGLSQVSAFSLTLADTEGSLSQANNWITAFESSQEAWSLEDWLVEEGDDDQQKQGNKALAQAEGKAEEQLQKRDGGEEEEEEEESPDSVEAVARAAEALSPSRQNQGISPFRPPPQSAASSTPSPMHPPPPQLVLPGGTRGMGSSPVRSIPSAAMAMAAVAASHREGVVRVGVACLVTTPKMPGCVLVGKRKGSVGAGTVALPGGHLEVGEEWSACAAREVLEETGLQVETPTFSWVINCPGMEGGKHYVTVFMLAAVSDPDQNPTLTEPDKCEGWYWAPWKSLGTRKSRRGSSGGISSRRGDRLFKPLACLRATNYDPFTGVL